MKTYCKILFISSCLYAQIDYGFEFSKGGLAGFQFLKIETSAVSQSLSGAFATASKDSRSIHNNVSRMSKSSKFSFSVSNQDWLSNSKVSSASISYRIGNSVFGFNLVSFKIKEFEETTVRSPMGTGRKVSAGNNLIGFGLARNFTDKLSLGMQLKYVEERLDNYSYNNIMFDFGSNFKTGFRDIDLAFVFQHIGPDVTPLNTKFRSPLMFRIGASDYIFKSSLLNCLTIFELVHPTDSEDYIVIAQEYNYKNKLLFRIGNKLKKESLGLSLGFGIEELKLRGGNKVSLDYGILFAKDLFQDLHSFSISFNK